MDSRYAKYHSIAQLTYRYTSLITSVPCDAKNIEKNKTIPYTDLSLSATTMHSVTDGSTDSTERRQYEAKPIIPAESLIRAYSYYV